MFVHVSLCLYVCVHLHTVQFQLELYTRYVHMHADTEMCMCSAAQSVIRLCAATQEEHSLKTCSSRELFGGCALPALDIYMKAKITFLKSTQGFVENCFPPADMLEREGAGR